MSPSAAHCGHHPRTEFRPRRITSESVSIVIFVRFAIALTLAVREAARSSFRNQRRPACPNAGQLVLGKLVITSDNFSQPSKLQKRKPFRSQPKQAVTSGMSVTPATLALCFDSRF
jgi:hypothetical protein